MNVRSGINWHLIFTVHTWFACFCTSNTVDLKKKKSIIYLIEAQDYFENTQHSLDYT